MLTSQRKRLILDRLARDGEIVAKALSRDLDLSEDTIRRDLRELAAEGLLQRVHGGALPASPTVVGIAARSGMSVGGKAALGREAATMLRAGQTIFLDGGTTNLEIVRHLAPGLALTVVTHSPSIAMALESHQHVEVIMVGGKLYRHSMVTVGALAIEAISRLRIDSFFLGVTGVHAGEGLTTGDIEEAAVKRVIVSRAAETIVMATTDKLGAVSPAQVVPLAQIDTLIVEADVPDDRIEPLERAGTNVVRAQ